MELRREARLVPLHKLCQSIVDCPHSTPTWTNHGVIVLRNQNIRDGKLDLSTPSYTDEMSFASRIRRARPIEGDLVITREAPMGEVCMIPVGLRCCLGQRMVLLRPNREEIAPKYLLYAIQSATVQTAIRNEGGTGSTVSNLRIPVLAELKVPVPATRVEQENIAAALSDTDDLIAGLEQLIAKKRAIKQAAMQQLLTGKTRLPGFDGEWETKRLATVADVKTGPFGAQLHESDYVRRGTPIITVEHLGEFGVDCTSPPPMVSDKDRVRLQQYCLRTGDIVFSRVGSIDRNALIRQPQDGWLFSGRLLRVRPGAAVAPEFLSYYFHGEAFRSRIRTVAVGQTMASLNTKILNDTIIEFPSLPEQRSISTILGDIDAETMALEQKRNKTHSLKQGMMQELLTGRIRLI